jgi:hypothetical protein
MNFGRICGFAIVGAVAGAVVAAALLASPSAYADDVATLPVPPFDPTGAFNVSGILAPPAGGVGSETPPEYSTIPGGFQLQYDETWPLSGGSYETHQLDDVYGLPENYFEHDSTVVTASEGVAPPVGTEWDTSIFSLPSWGYSQELFINHSLTTSAGTVDVFTPQYIPLLAAWSNEFYNGPAGIFDDLVSNNGAAVIPIIDIPATASTAAAADFGTLWSEFLGTL